MWSSSVAKFLVPVNASLKMSALRSTSVRRLFEPRRSFSSNAAANLPYTVGFIGLGNMGYSMAKNLMEAKTATGPELSIAKKLIVLDTDSSKVAAMEAMGASAAESLESMASECDVIITMLPNSSHVKEVVLGGGGGIIASARPNTLLIDCSTIDPLVSRTLHEAANQSGMSMIDAPVSGGVTGAAAGTLTFMVGGTQAALEQSKAVLGAMGKNIVHCGDAGAGGVAKLCNNLSLAIAMIGTSEAMNLGMQLGMDSKVLAGILNTSTGRCWSSDSYNPVPGVLEGVPSSNGYNGGFGTSLMLKDLDLVVDLAQSGKSSSTGGGDITHSSTDLSSEFPVPLGAHARDIYRQLTKEGYAEKDFSSVYDFFKNKTP